MPARDNGRGLSAAPDVEALQHFFELSLDLFAVADFEGNLKRLNRSWRRVLGYSEDELLSRPYIEFVHPEDRDATLAALEKLVGEQRDAVAFENRFRCRDGSCRRLLWRAESDPRQGRVYAAAKDITEHKQVESLGQLAGEIAHEFNNLLCVILSYATLLIDDLDDPRRRQDVEEIHRAAERAAELTHRLLVFSRHDAGSDA